MRAERPLGRGEGWGELTRTTHTGTHLSMCTDTWAHTRDANQLHLHQEVPSILKACNYPVATPGRDTNHMVVTVTSHHTGPGCLHTCSLSPPQVHKFRKTTPPKKVVMVAAKAERPSVLPKRSWGGGTGHLLKMG